MSPEIAASERVCEFLASEGVGVACRGRGVAWAGVAWCGVAKAPGDPDATGGATGSRLHCRGQRAQSAPTAKPRPSSRRCYH